MIKNGIKVEATDNSINGNRYLVGQLFGDRDGWKNEIIKSKMKS